MSRYDMIKGIIPPIITPMNEDESFNSNLQDFFFFLSI